MYSIERWKKDGDFKAEPGEEVTEELYFHMLNVMPPVGLVPKETRERLGFQIIRAFLVGEPYDHDPETGRAIYHAFGRAMGPTYWYLGLSFASRAEGNA